MREKEIINVELLEALERVAEQYQLLGNHYIDRASYIRRDGLNPDEPTGIKLGREVQLIQMTISEWMMKIERLRFELGSLEEESQVEKD